MSRFLPERLLARLRQPRSAPSIGIVGLSAQGAAWYAPDPMRQARWQHRSWSESTEVLNASVLTDLVASLAPTSGQDIRWMLAPSLVRHWLQHPPTQTASLAELHAVAQARAKQQFGLGGVAGAADTDDWTLAADWHGTQPFLCAGIVTGLHQALRLASRDAPVILSPLMLALSRCRRQLPRHGWLAVVLVDEFHVLQMDRGRPRRMRSVRMAPQTPAVQVEHLVVQEWQREQLRAPSDAQTLHWLHLAPTSTLSPTSPALRPIHWATARSARAHAVAVSTELPVSEAMQAAWCGHLLLAGNPP